jgi:recombination protein RecT
MSNLAQQTRQQQDRNAQGADRATDLVRKVNGQRAEIAKALGDRIGPERFLRALATEIRTTEHLDECTPDSVLGGLYVAAQMGLEIGGPRGLVYLVPYKRRGGQYEASLIVGYKGFVELLYRAGAKAVQWFLVREGDTFRIGSDARIGKTYEWIQADPNSSARVTGAVAQVITPNGGVVWEYLSRADIEKRATSTPFWQKWWDEMALKTVLRRLVATAPLSTELRLAAEVDETVQQRIPGIDQPAAKHLPLTAAPAVAPAPAAVPRQAPAQQPPAAPVEDDQRSQYVDDDPPPVEAGPGGELTEAQWAEIERQQYEDAMAEQEQH